MSARCSFTRDGERETLCSGRAEKFSEGAQRSLHLFSKRQDDAIFLFLFFVICSLRNLQTQQVLGVAAPPLNPAEELNTHAGSAAARQRDMSLGTPPLALAGLKNKEPDVRS